MITKEDIIHWFEVLKNKCDRVTTGNCSHEINSIRFLASNWATIKGMCTRNIEFIEKCGIEE